MSKISRVVPHEIYSHRFQELDALRGLAAFTVVLHHFALVNPSSRFYHLLVSTPLHLFVNGPEAVILFFLLSGFVLSSLWSRSRHSGYLAYSVKRMLRLCLPYYAALVIAWLLALRFFSSVPTSNAWINQTWTMKATPLMALQTALTGNRWAEQFNTAFWTVNYEIRISLIFPLLFWVAMRVPTLGLIAALVVVQATVPITHVFDSFVDTDLLAAIVEFMIGIVLYRELPHLLQWVQALPKRRRGALLCGSLLLYAVALRAPAIRVVDTTNPVQVAGKTTAKPPVAPGLRAKAQRGLLLEADVARLQFAILGAVGVMLSAMAMPRFRTWLHHPALLRLGALSYSSYLLHGSILFVLIRLYYGRSFFPYLLPLYLSLVYVSSVLFHRAIDEPSILLGRHAEKWLLSKLG